MPAVAAVPHWDDSLQALLQGGLLTGFACITSRGKVETAEGCLEQQIQQSGPISRCQPSGLLEPAQLLKLFDGVTEVPAVFEVFHATTSEIYAISRRRALGLCIHKLPFGVLVTIFGRDQLPQAIIPHVERICSQLRH